MNLQEDPQYFFTSVLLYNTYLKCQKYLMTSQKAFLQSLTEMADMLFRLAP
jgi:hypothetical protein